MQPYVTLTSDFRVQSQGVDAMEAQIFKIAPQAKVIHLMHGLPAFDIRAGARTLETLDTHPVGFHVCVVDPGVGTSRNPIVIQTKRGDYLIGPDNGVLMPAATSFLGGIKVARKITNSSFMREEISPLFHGRDIFAPTAAHLASGKEFEDIGPEIHLDELCSPAYIEAFREGNSIEAEVIQINGYGSMHLNIRHKAWDDLSLKLGNELVAEFPCSATGTKKITLVYATTFGDVLPGKDVILKDDYGRVEIATNCGRFVDKVGCELGHKVLIKI